MKRCEMFHRSKIPDGCPEAEKWGRKGGKGRVRDKERPEERESERESEWEMQDEEGEEEEEEQGEGWKSALNKVRGSLVRGKRAAIRL